MQINVKTLKGPSSSFEVESFDSVQSLKSKIYAKHLIQADQIRLIYSGKLLEDQKSLCDYDIKDGSTIHVVMALRGGEKIGIKCINGKTITLEAEIGMDTIGAIKAMIEMKEGIEAALQSITFKGKDLDNSKTLADYHFQKSSVLHLIVKIKGG